IIGQSSVATAAGALTLIDGGTLLSYTGGNGYGGWQAPDIVGNLRVDQAWGSAQIMAAAHEVTPLYYGPTTATAIEGNGHPGDQWGWAVGFGAKILTPAITQGDFLYGEVNYTKGASKYAANTAGTTQEGASGLGQTYGIMSDCVFGGVVGATASSCDLTTAWSGVLSYEHYWTPQWHESFTGAYIAVSYDAQSNAILCTLEGGGNGFVAAGIGTAALATPGCNNNWSYWGAGSRLQWDITKSLYIGVEALYLQTGSAQSWNGLVPAAVGITAPSVCSTGAVCAVSNEHAWVGTVRIHKDFLP
ncbi:MAG: porin, partial [Xanthobacteraceae bacterium]